MTQPLGPEALRTWNVENRVYPMPMSALVDYHRGQLEHWLWERAAGMEGPILDIGAEWERGYLQREMLRGVTPAVYITLNTHAYDTEYGRVDPHIKGDVTTLDKKFPPDSLGTIIATEVLEHVADIFGAVQQIKAALMPGGQVFITTPFLWPEHGSENFKDYWRLTADAYEYLFSDFEERDIRRTVMRPETRRLWLEVARREVMDGQAPSPTGFLFSARKPRLP